jgi:hypothetical protein
MRSHYPSIRSRRIQDALRARRGVVVVTGQIEHGPDECLVALGNELARRGKRVLGLFHGEPRRTEFEFVGGSDAGWSLDFKAAAARLRARSAKPQALVVEQIRDLTSARAVFALAERALVLTMLWSAGEADAAARLAELLGPARARRMARLRLVIAPRARA